MGHGALRWRVVMICLALAVITFAVFGQTLHHGFVNFDDDQYVYKNKVVTRGLTLKGAVWALTFGGIGHWHPLTWLSHMADCQFYGLNPVGHHLTNVLLHTATVILLFLVLWQMTAALWRSAFVAAVFAIHPLRVESVAWIAERKDVLSGVFFMLTIGAYVRYARQPSRGRYTVVALCFGLGLLCKNTLVTLPFVLLLLDWWPLRRVKQEEAVGVQGRAAGPASLFGGLVKEKIPLFLLSVGSCVATFLAPEKMAESARLPLVERISNAVVSYGIYLRQMVYPAGLIIPYLNPPHGQPFLKIALTFVLLAAISIGVLAWRNKFPCLLVGWLWYLGMLVPMIGIVQISYYFHADRYTYLPEIGLALAGTWAVSEWSATWKHRQAALGSLMVAVIGALMICAWKDTAYWRDSETLWTHTLACTTGNYMAHDNLGSAFLQKGKVDDAIAEYKKALQINPAYVIARNNLGNALLQNGKADEAMSHYQETLHINPDFVMARNNLGNALLREGKVDEAIVQYQEALQNNPNFAEAHFNLGNALLRKGETDEAIYQYQEALRINPGYAEAHNNLGRTLCQKGSVDEGVTQFQMALQINPVFVEAHNNLGNAFMEQGRVDEAIAEYQKALAINPDYAAARKNLDKAVLQKQ